MSSLFWSNLAPAAAPFARFGASMNFFPPTGKMILFGGQSSPSGPYLNDTWNYDPATNVWAMLTPATSPPALNYAGSAFDPITNKIVLFGGYNGTAARFGSTWTYGSGTWTNVSPATSPSPRNGPSMAYDPTVGKIILFGGYSTMELNDTWVYDTVANTWTMVTPPISPPVRDSATMVFDPTSGNIILFGGIDTGTALGDTWSYNSASNVWTNLTPGVITPTNSPSPRFGYNMSFDIVSSSIVLFGGGFGNTGSNNETWRYKSSTNTWTQLVLPPTVPAPRVFASSAFSAAQSSLILFGGSNTLTTAPTYGDTWALAPGTYPSITSDNSCTFYSGDGANTFTVTTSGDPTPSLTVSGTLPTGVTFVDNGDGTGSLAGNPTGPGVPGTFPLTFTATNGVGAPAVQPFSLIVSAGIAPTITSSPSVIFYSGDTVNTFTVTTTGTPTPEIHESGTLPTGITFVDNGDGTGTLAGTTTQTGIFPIQFLANNFVLPTAGQNFTLVVEQGVAPEFTSPAQATYVANTPFNFTVTTLGYPVPALSEFGDLPPGVTFVDNGNGTGTLSGSTGETGTFVLTFTASNGITDGASQIFTLTIITALPPIDIHSIRTERDCEEHDSEGKCHDHKHYFNVLVWGAPVGSSPITNYTIYRSKSPGYPGPPIANVLMPGALYFIDPICKKKSYTYYITSTDTSGNISIPAIFKVRWK